MTTSPATGQPARSLWRHRDFLLLWGGQSVSEMGSAVTMLALPLTAVVVLKASTLEVGLLSAASTLAFLVIALPAGALVDRRAKRQLMLACDAARILIIGSVPLAAAFGLLTMAQLFVVALLAGIATVFFDVAYQSYVPHLVNRAELIDANGKLTTTAEISRVAGPGLGGGLVAAFGAAGSMAADAVSYAVSVASLALIRTREPAERAVPGAAAVVPGAAEAEPGHSPAGDAGGGRRRDGKWAEISAGLRFVLSDRILRKIAACTGTCNLFGGVTNALDILFLVRVLHVAPAVTGLLMAPTALGGVAGGLVAGRLAKRIGSARVIWVSILIFQLPGLLIPLAQPGWGTSLFVLGYAATSFSAVVYNVAQVSYRQSICPPKLMGRMNAAIRWIVWGTLPLGGVLGGALGAAFGIRPALWIAVVGEVLAGLWVLFSPLRGMRDVTLPASFEVAG